MGGFYFVGNALQTDLDLPLEVLPHVRLQRPTDKQQLAIDEHLAYAGIHGRWAKIEYRKRIEFSADGHGHGFGDELPKDQWRSFILAYRDEEERDLITALEIGSPSIWCAGCWSSSEAYGEGDVAERWQDPIAAQQHYQTFTGTDPTLIDQELLDQVRTTFANLKALDQTIYTEVSRALSAVVELGRFVQQMSDIRILALFAILEMLLTHQPKSDGDDSITHQIVSKIRFLEMRGLLAIDYSMVGADQSQADAIWRSLYSFRSALTHGRVVDFKRGPLRVLLNGQNAQALLDDAARRLIRQAIADPELFRALRPM